MHDNDLAWPGSNNRPGVRDIIRQVYLRSPSNFARLFWDSNAIIGGFDSCICGCDINQEAPYVHCLCCDSAFHMTCFLSNVVNLGVMPLKCFYCQSSPQVGRQHYPKLDCDIGFACIPTPESPMFFRDHKQPHERFEVIYWPAELNGTHVERPNLNLHTAQGRRDYQTWEMETYLATSNLAETRVSHVLLWMKQTYFQEAYIKGGEFQFDVSIDEGRTCLTSASVWNLRGWRNAAPQWYRSRNSRALLFDITDGDHDDAADNDNAATMDNMSIADNDYDNDEENNDQDEGMGVAESERNGIDANDANANMMDAPVAESERNGNDANANMMNAPTEAIANITLLRARSNSSSSSSEYEPPPATSKRNNVSLLAGNGMTDEQVEDQLRRQRISTRESHAHDQDAPRDGVRSPVCSPGVPTEVQIVMDAGCSQMEAPLPRVLQNMPSQDSAPRSLLSTPQRNERL